MKNYVNLYMYLDGEHLTCTRSYECVNEGEANQRQLEVRGGHPEFAKVETSDHAEGPLA